MHFFLKLTKYAKWVFKIFVFLNSYMYCLEWISSLVRSKSRSYRRKKTIPPISETKIQNTSSYDGLGTSNKFVWFQKYDFRYDKSENISKLYFLKDPKRHDFKYFGTYKITFNRISLHEKLIFRAEIRVQNETTELDTAHQ